MTRAQMRPRLIVVTLVAVMFLEAGAVAPASTVSAARSLPAPESTDPEVDERVDPDPDNGEPVELVDERTATSQTFDNQDGSFTTTVFSHPVYYEAAQAGEWVPIDVSFEPASGDAARTRSSSRRVPVVESDLLI